MKRIENSARPCASCSGYGWIAVNKNGDPRQPDVERCDACERYPSDGHARVALHESWFVFEKKRRQKRDASADGTPAA